jgi:hypothetical protein
MASPGRAFSPRAHLDRDTSDAGGTAAAQRSHGLDHRHRGNMESMSRRARRAVRTGNRLKRHPRPGRQRRRSPGDFAAHEMGDVFNAGLGAVGNLARRRHGSRLAAVLDFHHRAIGRHSGAGGDGLSRRPERVRIRRGRKTNRRAVRGTARRSKSQKPYKPTSPTALRAGLRCNTPTRRL